jgi:hypothetical protein
MTCRNCGEPIERIITTDGVGWYHPLPDEGDGTKRVQESCYGVGIPVADPITSETPDYSEA